MTQDELQILYFNALKDYPWADEVKQRAIDAFIAVDAMSDDDKQAVIDAYNEQQRTELQAKIDQAQKVLDDANAQMEKLPIRPMPPIKVPVEEINN